MENPVDPLPVDPSAVAIVLLVTAHAWLMSDAPTRNRACTLALELSAGLGGIPVELHSSDGRLLATVRDER